MTYCNPFLQFNFSPTFALGNYLGSCLSQTLFGNLWGGFMGNPCQNMTFTNPFYADQYISSNMSIFAGGINYTPQFTMPSGFDTFSYSGSMNWNSGGAWGGYGSWQPMFTSWDYTSSNITYKASSKKIDDYNSDNPDFRERMVANAQYYVGKVNNDSEGNALFSGGKTRHWCADFVTSITKKTLGGKFPSDFGTATRNGKKYYSCGVAGIMYWGQDKHCFYELPSSNKRDYIAQNIKSGDILIQKKANGELSHTAIVVKVYENGSFDTVDGNASNKVKVVQHHKDEFINNNVAGFVRVSQYA